jgi:methyltransferase (TIGR00027 family)
VSAERVSKTSQLIAAAILYAGTRPELARCLAAGDLDLYRARLHLCSRYARRLAWLSRPGVRGFSALVERFLVPGIVAHYVVRKMILREVAAEAIRTEGIRQCVILGGGLDPLGRWIAASFGDVNVLETDRADGIAMKETLLGGERRANHVLRPHDLQSASIDDALRSAEGFRPGRPTLVIAEGILMYRPLEEVRQLLASLAERPRLVVFTFMEDDLSGRIRFRNQNRLVTWWLGRSGEPFRWGMCPDRMTAFLAEFGFSMERIIDSAIYASERQLLPSHVTPPAGGELIAVARSLVPVPAAAFTSRPE